MSAQQYQRSVIYQGKCEPAIDQGNTGLNNFNKEQKINQNKTQQMNDSPMRKGI